MQSKAKAGPRVEVQHPLAALVSERPAVTPRFSSDSLSPPWLVLEGDVRDGLAALASNSVDCVVTSPPYFWQRDYGMTGQIGHESSIGEFVTTLRACFAELRRVLKADGTFFIGDRIAGVGRPS
jgi:tRNA1(Val) A37 N6-methylase TrmN6